MSRKMWFLAVIIVFVASAEVTGGSSQVDQGITSCEEFKKGARFNPHDILDSLWKVYYFWANTTDIDNAIIFSLPAKQKIDRLRTVVNTVDPLIDIDWKKVTLLMAPRPWVTVALEYQGTPGAFRALVKVDIPGDIKPLSLPKIEQTDVQMKMIGRDIGIMFCEELTAYTLTRINEMPKTHKECQARASVFNFLMPDGDSYLFGNTLDDEL